MLLLLHYTTYNRGKASYFHGGVLAYALGLAACFYANAVSHSGQPALLYLNPAIISSALLVAAINGGEWQQLFGFRQKSSELPSADSASDGT
jgi:minor histocompatibility antigen H13